MYNDQNTLEKNNDVHKEEIITGTNIMFGGALNIVQDIAQSCTSICTFASGKQKMFIPKHVLDVPPGTTTVSTTRRLKGQFRRASDLRRCVTVHSSAPLF